MYDCRDSNGCVGDIRDHTGFTDCEFHPIRGTLFLTSNNVKDTLYVIIRLCFAQSIPIESLYFKDCMTLENVSEVAQP